MNEDKPLAGRVAIVTGGGRGLGRAMTLGLANAGAAVVATASREPAEIESLSAAAPQGRILPVIADVTSEEDCARAVATTLERFGRLDILINNAGFGGFAPLGDDDYDRVWDRTIAGLLTAQQRMVRAALVHLRKSDAARIVNIASTEGLGATPGDSPYAVAKTGVIGLTRALAVDLGPEGITVNCICPGPIRTALTDAIPEEHKTIFAKRRTALKRYGYPEEVAHITFSLCLPAASYITGAIIPVDGGLMIRNA